MTETLYNRDILRLASHLETDTDLSCDTALHRLGTAEKKAKICGSKAAVKIALDSEERLVDAIFSINSCAMGQASTALLMQNMRGRNCNEISEMRETLRNRLEGQDTDISDWPALSILDAARGYSARHGAILLPYDTILKAMDSAKVKELLDG